MLQLHTPVLSGLQGNLKYIIFLIVFQGKLKRGEFVILHGERHSGCAAGSHLLPPSSPLTPSVGELREREPWGELYNQQREGVKLYIWFWNFPAPCEMKDDCMTKPNASPMALERHWCCPLSLHGLLLSIQLHIYGKRLSSQYLILQIGPLFMWFRKCGIKSDVLFLFICFFLPWVFFAELRLSVVAVRKGKSSCGTRAAHWGGFSCCRARAPGPTGFSSWSMWTW